MARFLAFVGMVVVNFKLAMGTDGGSDWLSWLTTLLEGKAAATFVVLAGIGLVLANARHPSQWVNKTTLKRSVFLLALGLVNLLIFDADILHYYAFYFLFGMLLLPLSNRSLMVVIVAINAAFFVMVLALDYEAGWHWETLTYEGLWTAEGFVRHLLFNGWHPLFPWMSFFLYGVILGRMPLAQKSTQLWMMISGALMLLFAEFSHHQLRPILGWIDPLLVDLASTEAIPPMPLYIFAGIGAASMVVGACLYAANSSAVRTYISWCLPAGRQSLTLYIAHIVLGMGLLEAFGLLSGKSIGLSVALAMAFCALSVVYAVYWSRYFKHGPVEFLMRKTAG